MALYLAKMACLEVRFQSTLPSKLLRFKLWVAELKKLLVSGAPAGTEGIRASIFAAIESIPGSLFPANCLRPVPLAAPVEGSKIMPTRSCCTTLLVSSQRTGSRMELQRLSHHCKRNSQECR